MVKRNIKQHRKNLIEAEMEKRKLLLTDNWSDSCCFIEKIDASIEALFQYTRIRVSKQDIVEFSPNDPGYDDYVKVWVEILRSGSIPKRSNFDLTEVIGLTGWVDSAKEKKESNFLNYRRFTSAVALGLIYYGNDSEIIRPINYLARDLIVDLDIENKEYFALLRKSFPAMRERLSGMDEELEYPFFTFGELILSQMSKDYKQSDLLATKLIRDEKKIRDDELINYLVQDKVFLLGLTIYGKYHSDWLGFSRNLVNPNNNQDMQFVINSFSAIGSNKF